MVHEFYAVIYPVRVWVVIGDDVSSLNEAFTRYPGGSSFNEYENDDVICAHTSMVRYRDSGNIGVAIIFHRREDMIMKYIVHESVHAASCIWSHIGEVDIADEANAYLTGWIAQCCEEARNNKLKKAELV